MVSLIEECDNIFRIDLQETMTTALQGWESWSQLEVAHTILLKCLLVAQQTVSKYEAQYQNTEVPLSLILTVPEIYNDFD